MHINDFYEKIDSFFAAKDFQGAENFMTEKLAEAEEQQDHGAVVTVCNELGGFYRAFSRYQEGIPLYEKALESLSILNMENSEAHGTTLLNFATTLAIIGEDQRALESYWQAAAIFEGFSHGRDFRLAALYNNISSLYQNMGLLPDAKDYLLKAMEILQTLTESEIEIATTWSNLAGVYLAMGIDALADAKDAAQNAISLFQKVSGDQDVHYAAAVSALGEVYYLEGDFNKAEAQFRLAMSLTERDYGNQTLGYALLCDNLSAALQAQGRKEEAAEYSKRAAAIKERIG